MDEKLNYLKKYNKNINILNINEIDKIKLGVIPDEWYKIFKEKDVKKRIDLLLNIWKKYISIQLRNTISYLNEHLESVELMYDNNSYSVLYTIKNSKGNYLYYEGKNPRDKFENVELENVWENTPETIRNFYENIHNGFYYYASESMGLVPFDSVTYIGDEDLEWGIIDDLEETIEINLDSSFGFFTNGMGSYIVVDYSNCDKGNGTFWSSKIKPKYNIDFWSYVDEWIVIGFE
ncbi:hypothetical protein [Clostridium diolis]|uniref:SMI1/KNR4 family protein n=1 Tax=Clostridium diolis TaxID=223919 RepID=A0AAV3VSD4_9CLOT|nr:hypothetical protein [Clostridium diolis]QES75411.1 SMI1/KNR4 family protein [Clostridium diolis]GEA29398.1 hypothetical protein CDIOL_03210 [Clostridium diolis]